MIEGIVLVFLGVLLIFIEIFIIPSFGPIGVLGGLLVAAGACVAGYREGFKAALTATGLGFGFALPACGLGFWLLPRTRIGGSLIHRASERSDEGFRAAAEPAELVGRRGEAVTPLRPSGIALIDGRRVDVVAEGEFIERGRRVEVVKVEGNRVVSER